jgi:hypothetical protein
LPSKNEKNINVTRKTKGQKFEWSVDDVRSSFCWLLQTEERYAIDLVAMVGGAVSKNANFEITFKFQIFKLSETSTHLKFPKTEQKNSNAQNNKKKMFPLPHHIVVVSHHFTMFHEER